MSKNEAIPTKTTQRLEQAVKAAVRNLGEAVATLYFSNHGSAGALEAFLTAKAGGSMENVGADVCDAVEEALRNPN